MNQEALLIALCRQNHYPDWPQAAKKLFDYFSEQPFLTNLL